MIIRITYKSIPIALKYQYKNKNAPGFSGAF